MSYVRWLRGLVSGVECSASIPMNLDPVDGRPVEMVLDLDRLRHGPRFPRLAQRWSSGWG